MYSDTYADTYICTYILNMCIKYVYTSAAALCRVAFDASIALSTCLDLNETASIAASSLTARFDTSDSDKRHHKLGLD